MATKTIQMVVNKPMKASIQYVNVWPNDLTKNSGKGYGASLNLKGNFDGEAGSLYPKGFLNRNIQALVDAGVIQDGNYAHDPAEKYSIDVQKSDVTLILEQGAGEKYPTFKIVSENGTKPAPATNGKAAVQEPVSVGRLPGDDDTPLDGMVQKYGECLLAVRQEIAPVLEKGGFKMDTGNLLQAAATLFIERNRKNV